MTYGLTSTGFVRKTYADILADFEAWQRQKISTKLVFDDTPLGDLNAIIAEHLAQLWEGLEAVTGAFDPDRAVEQLLIGLCKLTGVYREPAAKGRVYVDLTFDQALTIPAGTLLLAVEDESSNTWTNVADVLSTGAETVEDVLCESSVASSDAVAPAGTLQIATPITGLLSVYQAEDAVSGTDAQDLDSLRIARENSLAVSGSCTVAAITAEVAAVDGVVDVWIGENDTDAALDGIPPHHIRVVVWDGAVPAADDDEIGAAIYTKAAGIPTYGSTYVDVDDPFGDPHRLYFDRATQLEPVVVINVVGTSSEADVKAAIVTAHEQSIGTDVIRLGLMAAVWALPDISDVTVCTIDGVAANLIVAQTEVAVLDTSRITVNYD